jgi:hypothetical protein
MRARLTQTARVEQLLRRRGEHGMTAAEFTAPTVDGGPPIFRVAARVAELRARGLAVVSEDTRDGGLTVYVLREPQRVTVTAPAEAPGAMGQLVLDRPRSAILGPEDDG